jgi:hypothetical protein
MGRAVTRWTVSESVSWNRGSANLKTRIDAPLGQASAKWDAHLQRCITQEKFKGHRKHLPPKPLPQITIRDAVGASRCVTKPKHGCFYETLKLMFVG